MIKASQIIIKLSIAIFIIVGIIFVAEGLSSGRPEMVMGILIYGVPVVLDFIALKKIESSTSTHQLKFIAWLILFLGCFLGGVFMLCIKDKELQRYNETKTSSK